MQTFFRVGLVSLALLGLLAFSVLASSAASGTVVISGSATATCALPGTSFNGQIVPASTQTGSLVVSLDDFGAPDAVGLWLTFPDGRVYDVLSVYALDGLYDFVADNQTRYRMPLGEGAFSYLLTPKMPIGCYRLTVHSAARNQNIIVPFVVQASGKPATGSATLAVYPSRITEQQQEIALEIRGFLANEAIAVWLTQPDGVVIDVGYFPNAGPNFDLRPFYVNELLPVGRHYLTAQGVRSGYIAISPLDVAAGSAGVPTRNTRIDVTYTRNAQRATFVIAGAGYGVGSNSAGGAEEISFWLTYPNGKVLGLGSTTSDDRGVFEVTLYLSEQFPVGRFFISGRGNRSGQLAIAAFTLAEGNLASSASVHSVPVDPASLNANDPATPPFQGATAVPVEQSAPVATTPSVPAAPVEATPSAPAPLEPSATPATAPATPTPTQEAPATPTPPTDPAPPTATLPAEVPPTDAMPPAATLPTDVPPPAEAVPPLVDDGGSAPVAPPSIQP